MASAAWVSWRMGLASQGQFGYAKSWFDAAAAVAVLGLPQGLLHLQYRLSVPPGALRRWLLVRGFAVGAAALSAAVVLWTMGHPLAAAVAASLPFGMGHLIARSILLAQRGVMTFGIATALPSAMTLAGVVALSAVGLDRGFEALLLAVSVLAGTCTMVVALRSAQAVRAAWPAQELWRVSLQSWFQAALGALLPAALLTTVAWSERSDTELGAASLTLHLYQVFAIGAGLVAPLLFDRLARQQRPTLKEWPRSAKTSASCVLALSGLGLGACLAVPTASAVVWLLPASIVLSGGLAAVAARVSGTVLLARSAYAELSVQAAWRLLIAVVVAGAALGIGLRASVSLAVAVSVVEAVTWWRSAFLQRQQP